MKSVVVTLTDKNYFEKARRTILDVRTRGSWNEDIVLITVGFDAPTNFLEFYNIIPYRVEHLDTSILLQAYSNNPILPTCDNRETKKLTQWDKFYVFDKYFERWDKVIYVDAGLRVFNTILNLLELDCTGCIMAPDDAPSYDQHKRFGGIIEHNRNINIVEELFKEYNPTILNERYFLNCIWMYDTSLLQTITVQELVDAMNKYPICRCNEMTIMNLIFTFKYHVWKPFPEFCQSNSQLRLFGWTEHDRNYGPYTTWKDFCFIKYPTTINFDCE